MKRTVFLYFLTISIFGLIFNSCKKDDYLDWKYLNESWLEKHRNDEGWITESNGLQYRVIYEGVQDAQPGDKAYVYMRRTGRFINGEEFDSDAIEAGPLSSFPSGVIEGIKKMRRNAIYEFRIPYYLGYGDESYLTIPAYTTLIYHIELLNFESYNPYE